MAIGLCFSAVMVPVSASACAVSPKTILDMAVQKTVQSRTITMSEVLVTPITESTRVTTTIRDTYAKPDDFFAATSKDGSISESWLQGRFFYATAAGSFPAAYRNRHGQLVRQQPSNAAIRRATGQLAGKYIRVGPLTSFEQRSHAAGSARSLGAFSLLLAIDGRVTGEPGLVVTESGPRFSFSYSSARFVTTTAQAEVVDGHVVRLVVSTSGTQGPTTRTVSYSGFSHPPRIVPPPASDLVAVSKVTGCIVGITYICVR